MAYTDYPDNVMDEIIGGADGAQPNDAQKATAFLKEWTDLITQFFNEIFNFFAKLGEITKK